MYVDIDKSGKYSIFELTADDFKVIKDAIEDQLLIIEVDIKYSSGKELKMNEALKKRFSEYPSILIHYDRG